VVLFTIFIKETYVNLTTSSTVLLEKLVVAQLVIKFPPFVEPEGSLLCSQKSTTYPELDEYRLHPLTFQLKYYPTYA